MNCLVSLLEPLSMRVLLIQSSPGHPATALPLDKQECTSNSMPSQSLTQDVSWVNAVNHESDGVQPHSLFTLMFWWGSQLTQPALILLPLHSDSLTFSLTNPRGPWDGAAHLIGTAYYRGSVDLFLKKRWHDVGLPSVSCEYVLLPLVNKEAVFGQWLNRIELGRKLPGESRRGQGEAMYLLPKTDMPEPCR